MTEKHRVNFFYILLLFYILNYNFNVVISIFPTSFSQINSTNGFLIPEGRYPISIEHGDLNGDGNDDLIYVIGSKGLYVFYGPLASNFDFQTDISKINGSNGFIFLNTAVRINQVAVGDINNDGFDDIALFLFIIPGKICVIYGTDQIISPSTFSTVNGNNGFYISHVSSSNIGFGIVRSIIDFNGDSIKDLFVSASLGTFGSGGTPISYMIFGINGGKFQVNSQFEFDPSTLNGSNGFLINNFNPFSAYPYDMNHDGIGDIIINREQLAIDIIYGRGHFTSPYIPVYGGVKGTSFSFLGCSIISNILPNAFGDFNNDGLNDFGFQTRHTSGDYITFLVWGKTEYPPTTTLSINLNPLDGLAITIVGNTNTWALSPRLGDINNDGFADFLISGASNLPFTILYGNNKNYTSNPIYLKDQVGDCSIMSINGPAVAIDIGDYNSDGIDDIVIQSIKFIGQPNANCDTKCLNGGTCNPLTGCQCINDYYGDYCELKDCTVPQCLNGGSCNTTVGECSCTQGYEGIDCSGISCSVSCLNGGSCNTTVGQCQCINDFYGDNCGTKDCTVPQCLNGGSCNTKVGECSCTQGYEGVDCSGISCSVPHCLNGGSCNTTVGECLCTQGYEGIDCSGISCSVSCLNGGSCNTTVGQCQCVEDYDGDDCSSENKKKTNIGVIIGPILGGLALIAIIVVAIVLIKKKRNGNSKKNTNNIELRPQGSTVDILMGGRINNLDKF
ncbi:hypothetical protein ACTFIR_011062 [Dictyostelium discoideum]